MALKAARDAGNVRGHAAMLYSRGSLHQGQGSFWLFWRLEAWRLGKCHTIYNTWYNGVLYRSRYDTKSVRC